MREFIKENKFTLLRVLAAMCLLCTGAGLSFVSGIAASVLYLVAFAVGGCMIVYRAFLDLFQSHRIGEKLLMTVASAAAIAIGEYFEASLIVVLFEIGALIEDLAVTGSRRSVSGLSSLRPDKARLQGGEEAVPVEEVKIGELIEVRPGERVPLDGVMVQGYGQVDTSVLTGESSPRQLEEGSEALAGYLCLKGKLTIRVERAANQSAAQRIIDLSQGAIDKKTRNEKFIRRFANVYTPAIILMAVLLALIPPLFDGYNFSAWIYRACAWLAISCPCALVISVPLSYFCGIGYAAKRGVLIKSSSVMESLERINVVAFDKTGTLTIPELNVYEIEAAEGSSKIEVLKYACIAEMKSSHPMADAVKKIADKFNIRAPEGENYSEHVGLGVECDTPEGHVKAGSYGFVGATSGANVGTVFVSLNGKYLGCLAIGDEVKASARKAFLHLAQLGVTKRVILSGDKKSKVDMVARAVGADANYSNLLPEDKLFAIEDIYETTEGCRLAYCGDGINDLPSLARADVGVAMGALGSDAAVEKSDVVIMDDNVDKIPFAMKLARKVKRVVIENIAFAIGAKIAILLLSSFGILPLYASVLGDVGILILTVFNSLRAGR